jgi:hypothetical protein
VYGEEGKPLYSWRVLILPYIEQDDLYQEFRLNEPWDSPHNCRLLGKMPGTYAPPAGKAWQVPAYHTVCHVFVGRGAAFEGREGLRLPRDFTDGTSNTLLVVEAGKPVPWSKPENLAYPGLFIPSGEVVFWRALSDCSSDSSAGQVAETPEAV